MWIQLCIGHSGVYTEHYMEVKGRIFVSYESYLVLLEYMTGLNITDVSEVGQPLMGCRNNIIRKMSELSERCDGH